MQERGCCGGAPELRGAEGEGSGDERGKESGRGGKGRGRKERTGMYHNQWQVDKYLIQKQLEAGV